MPSPLDALLTHSIRIACLGQPIAQFREDVRYVADRGKSKIRTAPLARAASQSFLDVFRKHIPS